MKKIISILCTLAILFGNILFAADVDPPGGDTYISVDFPDEMEISNWPDHEPYMVSGLFSLNNVYAGYSDYKIGDFDYIISHSHIGVANIIEKYIYNDKKSPVSDSISDNNSTLQKLSYLISRDYWHRDSGMEFKKNEISLDLKMHMDLIPDSKSDAIMSLMKIYNGVIPSRPIMFKVEPVRTYGTEKLVTEVKGNQYTYAGLTTIHPSSIIKYDLLKDYNVYVNPNVIELYLEKAFALGLINEEELDPSTDFYDYRKNSLSTLPKWNNSLNAVYPFGYLYPDVDGGFVSSTFNSLSSMSTAKEIAGTDYFGENFSFKYGSLSSNSANIVAGDRSYFETEDMTMLELFEIIEKFMRIYEKDLTKLETEIINYRLSSRVPVEEGKDTIKYLMAMGIIDFEEPLYNVEQLVDEEDIINYLYRVANKSARSTFEFIELSEVEKEFSDLGFVSNTINFTDDVTLDYVNIESDTLEEDDIYPVRYKILMDRDTDIGKWGYSYRTDWFLTNTKNTTNRLGEYGTDYVVRYEEPYMIYKCTQSLYDLISFNETVYLNTSNGLDYPGIVRIDDGPGVYTHNNEVTDSKIGSFATTALITKKIDELAFLSTRASGNDENDKRLYTVELGLKVNGSVQDADPGVELVTEITDIVKKYAIDYAAIAEECEYTGYTEETNTMNFKFLIRTYSSDRAEMQAWALADVVHEEVFKESTLPKDTENTVVALLNEERKIYESFIPQNMLSKFGFTLIQEMILFHEKSQTYIFIIDDENAICGNSVYNVSGNTFKKLETDGRLFYSAELLTSSEKSVGDVVQLDTRTFGKSASLGSSAVFNESFSDYSIHIASNSKYANFIDYIKGETRCLIEFTYEIPGEGATINPNVKSELDILNYMNTRPTWSKDLQEKWDENYRTSNSLLKQIFGEDVDYEISGWMVPKVYRYNDVFADANINVPPNIAALVPIEPIAIPVKLNPSGLYLKNHRNASTKNVTDGRYNVLTWENPLNLELTVSEGILNEYDIEGNKYTARIKENGSLVLMSEGSVIKTLSSSEYYIEEKGNEKFELVAGYYNLFQDLTLESGLMYNLGRRIVAYDYLNPISEEAVGELFYLDGHRYIKNEKGGISLNDNSYNIMTDIGVGESVVIINNKSIPVYSFEEDAGGLYWYNDLSTNRKTIWKNATAYNTGYFSNIPLVDEFEFEVDRELLKTLSTISTSDSTIDEIENRINEVETLVKKNKLELLKGWIKFLIMASAFVMVFVVLGVYVILRFGIFKTTLEQLVAAHDLDLLYILSFGRMDIGSETNIVKTVGVIFLIMLFTNILTRMI